MPLVPHAHVNEGRSTSRRLAARLGEVGGLLVRKVGVRRHVDTPEHWLDAARAVMRKATYCTLVTAGASGPDARTVQPFRPDPLMVVHLGTSPKSRKALQIAASGQAVLVYTNDRARACVVAHCEASLISECATLHRYFMPAWRAFWPDGPRDDFIVVRCRPVRLEIWDLRRGVTPQPFGLVSAHLRRDDNDSWTADGGSD